MKEQHIKFISRILHIEPIEKLDELIFPIYQLCLADIHTISNYCVLNGIYFDISSSDEYSNQQLLILKIKVYG